MFNITGGLTTAADLSYASGRKKRSPRRGGSRNPSHQQSGSQGGSTDVADTKSLPSARLVGRCCQSTGVGNPQVSLTFHPDAPLDSTLVTHMVTQLGQFLDHDITLTPEEEAEDCCQHPDTHGCFPIVLPQDDVFFSRLSTPQTCLQFTRSTAFCEGLSSPREQMNAITAFVDASNVYGSSNETSALLRSGVDGKLKVNAATSSYDKEMLPEIDGILQAGDVRALEMPGLATMHTLWLREHNRIAGDIKSKSAAELNDEAIFQLARRIVVGEMQNVIYSEYLPVVLGSSAMRQYGLSLPSSTSDYSSYRGDTDPSIANSFATAAYRCMSSEANTSSCRFGHSMIQGLISMMSTKSTAVLDQFELRNNYFNMTNYLAGRGEGMEQILQGLVNQPAQRMDRCGRWRDWSENILGL